VHVVFDFLDQHLIPKKVKHSFKTYYTFFVHVWVCLLRIYVCFCYEIFSKRKKEKKWSKNLTRKSTIFNKIKFYFSTDFWNTPYTPNKLHSLHQLLAHWGEIYYVTGKNDPVNSYNIKSSLRFFQYFCFIRVASLCFTYYFNLHKCILYWEQAKSFKA
jgi:hypothetical protein